MERRIHRWRARDAHKLGSPWFTGILNGIAPTRALDYNGTVRIGIATSILLAIGYLAGAQTNAPAPRPLTLPELEQLYLAGRITAKEFQQHLKEVKVQSPQARPTMAAGATNQPTPVHPRGAATSDQQARALEMLRKVTGKTNDPVTIPTPQTNAAVPTPAPPPDVADPAIKDVETKMNELLRLKEAREKAAKPATNAPASNAPKTKRQRLDDLLKQFIDGKMTEAEYKQRREKIVGEPE